MANENAGDNPNSNAKDGNPYNDEEQGPPEFVYESREEAVKASREKGDNAKVSQKRVDGEQVYVVESRCDKQNTGAATLEQYRDDL